MFNINVCLKFLTGIEIAFKLFYGIRATKRKLCYQLGTPFEDLWVCDCYSGDFNVIPILIKHRCDQFLREVSS